jgi:hypothetical protein
LRPVAEIAAAYAVGACLHGGDAVAPIVSTVATEQEIMTLTDRHQLYGLGIGYVDAQLLAATQLTADATLWTGDRRLAVAASHLGCAINPDDGTPDLA